MSPRYLSENAHFVSKARVLAATSGAARSHETKLAKDPVGGHEWLEVAVSAIPAWFDAHR